MAQIELLTGERQEREGKNAILACNDFLRLGPGRSLSALLGYYAETGQNQPPTRSKATLKEWSQRFGWQVRAAAYDAELERQRKERDAELERQREARRREIMDSGLALIHERVAKLKALANFLETELYARVAERFSNVWLADAKQIGSGESFKRVDIVRFNQALIEEYRAVLDDLAKETGGRKTTTKLETPDLRPLPEAIRELAAKVYGQVQENAD
jgi:hypothetical protein